MRDIQFRGFYRCETGKDKISLNGEWIQGEWVYGNLIISNDVIAGYEMIIIPQEDAEFFIYDDVGELGATVWFNVIPETVGQYTGRKFKDKKCFTGDIIFARHSKILVDFDEDYLAYFTYYFDETKNKRKYCPLSDIAGYECLGIIGNIHSNRELLEVNE